MPRDKAVDCVRVWKSRISDDADGRAAGQLLAVERQFVGAHPVAPSRRKLRQRSRLFLRSKAQGALGGSMLAVCEAHPPKRVAPSRVVAKAADRYAVARAVILGRISFRACILGRVKGLVAAFETHSREKGGIRKAVQAAAPTSIAPRS